MSANLDQNKLFYLKMFLYTWKTFMSICIVLLIYKSCLLYFKKPFDALKI